MAEQQINSARDTHKQYKTQKKITRKGGGSQRVDDIGRESYVMCFPQIVGVHLVAHKRIELFLVGKQSDYDQAVLIVP